MYTKPTKVLFVCMGNICRSPAAEIVFHAMVKKAGLANRFQIDSAGTIGYHEGNPPDARMIRTLERRNYPVFGTSRPIQADDLAVFDHILVMDQSNLKDVLALDPAGKYRTKIRLLTNFCQNKTADHVPDPYYGGEKGFDQVVDLVEDACAGLLITLASDHPS